jgi:phospholipase D-like protein
MKSEDVARRFHQREGSRLSDFIDVALPVYYLTLRVVTLSHKKIPAIEEFILRAINLGICNSLQLSEFLGLDDRVLTPCLIGLVQTGDLNAIVVSENQQFQVTQKGRATIARAEIVSTEEHTFSIYYDALTRKIAWYRDMGLLTYVEIQAGGFMEISQRPPRRPRIADLRIPEIHKVAKSIYQSGEIRRDLLAITAIENCTKLFLPSIALMYRNDAGEPFVSVAIDGKLSADHERELMQNPGFQKFLAARPMLDRTPTQMDSALIPIAMQSSADARTLAEEVLATEAAIFDAQEALAESSSLKEAQQMRAKISELETELERVKAEAKMLPVKNIYVQDHPPLLTDALSNAKERLLIIAPWITGQIVDASFLKSLEELLRKGVRIHIGHGISPVTQGRSDPAAKAKLEALAHRYSNFTFARLGNTHAKVLIKDHDFAAVTSFNWLSFKGDPKRTFRDEQGVLLQRLDLVDAKYQEVVVQFP